MSKETDSPTVTSWKQDAQVRTLKDIIAFDYRIAWPIVSLLFGRRWKHHQMTGRLANIKEGENVLELGAGYPLWRCYSRRVGDGIFLALDSDLFIQKTSKKICFWMDKIFNKEGAKEDFLVADASRLPIDDESFDIVVANNLPRRLDYLSEAYRILKPGGRLITSWTDVSNSHLYTEQTAADCESVGFEETKIREGMATNWYVLARKPIGLSESGQGD
jgi:ubiquinone/menaquinone biosynthesis C-methylase UbiE